VNIDELIGHVDLNLARRVLHGERRLREQRQAHRHAMPDLVRVNGRPGEMLVGFDAWTTAAAGMVGVYFYDVEATEYFSPDQWAAAKREWTE
jgi:hypothetical protein